MHTYCRDLKIIPSIVARGIRYTFYIIFACGVTAVVGTKLHYTLDVFLAVFLTTSIWNFYHHAISHSKLKSQFGILQWLEAEEVMRIDEEAFTAYMEFEKSITTEKKKATKTE